MIIIINKWINIWFPSLAETNVFAGCDRDDVLCIVFCCGLFLQILNLRPFLHDVKHSNDDEDQKSSSTHRKPNDHGDARFWIRWWILFINGNEINICLQGGEAAKPNISKILLEGALTVEIEEFLVQGPNVVSSIMIIRTFAASQEGNFLFNEGN